MRRSMLLIGLSVVVAAGFGPGAVGIAGASAGRASDGSGTTKKTDPPTTIPIVTVPTSAVAVDPNAPAPTGKVLMVKMYVGDVDAAEQFYGAVFGAKLALKIGENA